MPPEDRARLACELGIVAVILIALFFVLCQLPWEKV